MIKILTLACVVFFLFNNEIDFSVKRNITADKCIIECDNDKESHFSAYIICDFDKYNDDIYHQAYLVVKLETGTVMKDLGGSFADTLFLNDIDGDNIKEIIIHQTKGISGGAGQYDSCVFKIFDNKIEKIFNSNSKNKFDTGFCGELKNNYELEIKNKFTGYMSTLNLFDNRQNVLMGFDENGNSIHNEAILDDSFNEFIPEDIDKDGIYELACLQYVSWGWHSNYIGDVKCYLKYNVQENKFEVVKAEFIQRQK